ncbi:MAG: DUF2244 domain-containing protein [Alphaproteobacteria bacterium]|nr:DUF2244 domain-containing protein [Alphaproteobacteria bacterium]
MSSQAEPVEPLFDAVLTPHRSLAPKGFLALMAVLAAGAAAIGLLFASRGAWPVLSFLGGEVLLVWIAFRVNYRRARAYETVRLTAEALEVEQVDPRGHRRRHRFAPPHWLRVALEPLPGRASRLYVASHGRALTIGRFLPPAEKASLAEALGDALRRLGRPAAG